MVVSNTYSVVLFVLFVVILCLVYGCVQLYSVVLFVLFVVVLCLVYGGVQHIYCCVICLACRRPVSCVWLCSTHIVLCYLSCLSSTCVLCMCVLCIVVSNTYSVVLFVLLVVFLFLVCGCVQLI